MQGMEVTSTSTGVVNGDETVDVNTGIVKQKNTVLETKGTVHVMEQDIPVTTKITSVTTIKPL
jgi:hypothetical protein